ncbi:MAG: SurA N-terminal domain-containing protein [Bacteroidetes bacterium]|nr:SurA N-terminal domain-containing protein [Bacteroidota bacterium]MBS1972878.1 SurA N-terminal domain-containing protein [Bacteroidota bacterium]
MSVIQQIRDKAAWLVFGLIALSLLGFLAMDAFVGRNRLFGGNSNIIGRVNGKDIEYPKFQELVEAMESQYKAQGYPVNDMMSQNIRSQVWDQLVQDDILDKIYQKTGIEVSDKELNDMLAGPNPVQGIRQSFTDKKTGIFDAQAAASTINQLRTIYKGNKKTDNNYTNAKRFFEELQPQWIKDREREKYLSMLSNSAYMPKWMAEKMISDQSQVSSISYVNTPYSTISDSAVKVTDEEINSYVQTHKEQYHQDESRSIAYVSFSAAPTSNDSAAVLKQITDLKPEFDTTHSIENFIARNGSDMEFSNMYYPKSKIQVPDKDSIFALPKGGVFGPYRDASDYVLAKKIDEKIMPDSVRARHILIATIDPKTGEQTMEDSIAKRKIDSIKTLIDNGAKFEDLALKLSDDEGSKIKGGDLGYFTSGTMVKEFNDFCFDGKKGDKKIIKTQFGYHYIEITDQKNFEPAYKIAYMAKKIEASSATDDAASGLASQFAGESRNATAFDANIKKSNYQKLLAQDIQPTASAITGLGTNRQLVKWIYDDKTSLGDVSEPYSVGDKYVVAILTEINKEGTMAAAKARLSVEPILRNQKKADLIIKKIGSANTLDAVSKATNEPVLKADSISFASPFIPNVGQEPKVIGASFDKQLQGKPASGPISGNGGVFVIKVENISAKSNPGADAEELRKGQQQQEARLVSYRALEALKKTAKIKDNRSKFF